MRRCCFLMLMIVVMLASNAAYAKTADGVTPSEETVCSGLAAPAFGLCNAYCEAMDCHLAEPHASRKACDQVRKNFQRKTGSDLPCESFACPCQIFPEFNAVVTSTTTVNFCTRTSTTVTAVSGDLVNSSVGVNDDGEAICAVDNQYIVLTPVEAEICGSLLNHALDTQGISCLEL